MTSGFYCADNKQSAPLWAVHYQWLNHVRITHAHILRYVIRRHESSTTVTRHSGLIWRIRSAITPLLPAQRYRAGHEFADWYWYAHIIHIDKRDCANPRARQRSAAQEPTPPIPTTQICASAKVATLFHHTDALCHQNADAMLTNYHRHSTSELKRARLSLT